MIEYRKGDLLSVKTGVIAHGVNCQGIMGAGVAKAIREKYPEVYRLYSWRVHEALTPDELLGSIQCIQAIPATTPENVLVVVNMFTQMNYGRDRIRYVSYDAIDSCFEVLANRLKLWVNPLELNIPKIGSGLGGGAWNVIESIINSRMQDVKVVCWEL